MPEFFQWLSNSSNLLQLMTQCERSSRDKFEEETEERVRQRRRASVPSCPADLSYLGPVTSSCCNCSPCLLFILSV